MVKLKDVAQRAKVSAATVSNVLNGKKNMSEEVRAHILKLCNEMGYDFKANNKGIPKCKTIAFNFSDFDRSFYLNIIAGINDCLTENGYDLIVCTNHSGKNFMKPQHTLGAISLDGKMSNEQLLKIASSQYPIVVMDRILQSDYIKSVIVDNFPVMCELVQKLIGKGYKRFGYLGGIETSLDNIERYGGFSSTLKANDIVFDSNFYYHGDFKEKSGYQAAKLMLLGNALPQILVCASDNMALGAIRAFREKGLSLPKDIAVVGFDDCDSARIARLTTVSIPRYENGYLAAKELLNLIKGTEAGQPFKIRATIKWRETC